MNGWFKLNNAVYWLALALWASALVSAGVAASFTFATLPDLGVTIHEFAAYQPDDPEAHGRLAAGMVLEKVFTAVDFAQVALAPLAVLTLVLQFVVFRMRVRRLSSVIRASCIGIAIVLAGYHIFLQAPTMNRELRAYWDAARAGDVTVAEEHRAAFEEFHPRAEFIIQANLVLLLVALGASAVAFTPQNAAPSEQEASSELEPPLLARQS